jgi:hypothetical protein
MDCRNPKKEGLTNAAKFLQDFALKNASALQSSDKEYSSVG